MTRVNVAVRVDDRLEARARTYATEHGLKLRQLIELALAHELAIPPAVAGLDIGPALCPRCEKAVVSSGRCDLCKWHAEPRPWKANAARARDTT
jgi:hypothetical protein